MHLAWSGFRDSVYITHNQKMLRVGGRYHGRNCFSQDSGVKTLIFNATVFGDGALNEYLHLNKGINSMNLILRGLASLQREEEAQVFVTVQNKRLGPLH